ncbi:nucleoside diphosphate kinase-like [Bradysia coprophila]|uniref:nucleoside diphosphate kinase-like n=1 Tax=Bradysia coprophila TaxID=38358 RepID=UPI00187D7459|nr:nucleoside diphosphate kinase-like [Bradysia coprophila]XP_037052254.1 nucleoside diphosphate kinase-like [Bradysia coprophila]
MLQKISILIAFCLFLSVQSLCDAVECEDESHEDQGVVLEVRSCSSKQNKTRDIPSGRAQRTFCLIKPDGVQRNLVGEIIKRYEAKGLKLVALKFAWPKEHVLREFYHHSAKMPFFEHMIGHVTRGPVVAMVWEGYNAVQIGRQLLTGGNRFDPVPGSIRGDFSSSDFIHRFTVAHGSDTAEEAEREMFLWFDENELISWHYSNEMWIYQK